MIFRTLALSMQLCRHPRLDSSLRRRRGCRTRCGHRRKSKQEYARTAGRRQITTEADDSEAEQCVNHARGLCLTRAVPCRRVDQRSSCTGLSIFAPSCSEIPADICIQGGKKVQVQPLSQRSDIDAGWAEDDDSVTLCQCCILRCSGTPRRTGRAPWPNDAPSGFAKPLRRMLDGDFRRGKRRSVFNPSQRL